jgi:hypothetical protein
MELGALYPQDARLSVDVLHTQSGQLAATKACCIHQHDGNTVDGVWQVTTGIYRAAADEVEQLPYLVSLNRCGQRVRSMAPKRLSFREKALTLATSAVPAEPINHHRPVDLGVMRTMVQLAAPTFKIFGIEVAVASLCEIGPQMVQHVLVNPDSTPECASTRDVCLHGSVKATQG